MSKSITQDMAYRQFLMMYTAKYGVGRASRKYNRARSYICFWKARWDGTKQSLDFLLRPCAPSRSDASPQAGDQVLRDRCACRRR